MPERKPAVLILEGACSTGTSTLAGRYDDPRTYPHVAVAHEAARQFFLDHPDIPPEERYTVTTQGAIQDACIAQIDRQVARVPEPEVVIADSSPLTAVAYAALGDEEKAQALFDRIEPWLHGIAAFLLMELDDIPYEHDPLDPVRQETVEQRATVHRNIGTYIQLSGRPLIHVAGNVEERMRRIDEVIARHRK